MSVSQSNGRAAPPLVPLHRRRARRVADEHSGPSVAIATTAVTTTNSTAARLPSALPIIAPTPLRHAPVPAISTAAVEPGKQRVGNITAAVEGRQALRAAESHQDPGRAIPTAARRSRHLARRARRRSRRQQLRRRRQHLGAVRPGRSIRSCRDIGHAEVDDAALTGGPPRRAQTPRLPQALRVILRPSLVRKQRFAFPFAACPRGTAADNAVNTIAVANYVPASLPTRASGSYALYSSTALRAAAVRSSRLPEIAVRARPGRVAPSQREVEGACPGRAEEAARGEVEVLEGGLKGGLHLPAELAWLSRLAEERRGGHFRAVCGWTTPPRGDLAAASGSRRLHGSRELH